METILASLITGLSVVVALYIERSFQAKDRVEQRKQEDERWYAAFFMNTKIEALNNILRVIAQLTSTYQLAGTEPEDYNAPYTSQQLKQLVHRLSLISDQLKQAQTLAHPYLTPELLDILDAAHEEFSLFTQKLKDIYSEHQIIPSHYQDELTALFRNVAMPLHVAVRHIGRELNPQALRKFAEER